MNQADNGEYERVPVRIVIERCRFRNGPHWRMEVQSEDGTVLDYTFASSRGLAWRMAKTSARRLGKEARR